MSNESDQSQPVFASKTRMTSIEAFHLYSSTEKWPNCVTSRYHFHGPIDVEKAKQAWQHCLGRQKHANWPILRGIWPKWDSRAADTSPEELAAATFHELTIEHFPNYETDLDLADGVNERGLPQISAAAQQGFTLWCVRTRIGDRATLIFAADHALCDGAAAIGFVRDWMQVYHNLMSDNPVDRGLVKLDWNRWKSRSHLGLLQWTFLKYLPCQAIGLFGATKFVFRKFTTIDADEKPEKTFRSPGIIGREVASPLVDALNYRAERLNVSVNSLLMATLFRAMRQVQKAVESDTSPTSKWSDRKWIRLVLPISVRTISDRKLPAANRASLVQIERTFEQVADADSAAQSIDREVRIIMGFKLDRVFLIAIRMLSAIPMLLRALSRNQKSRGTAVFTNLGEPFRKTRSCNFREVGNLELEEFDLCGPLRCGTPLNFAWSTFRCDIEGEMKLHGRVTLHYDRAIISSIAAESILQAFVSELHDVAG